MDPVVRPIARIRFEQFFTPELARQLEIEPDLLHGLWNRY